MSLFYSFDSADDVNGKQADWSGFADAWSRTLPMYLIFGLDWVGHFEMGWGTGFVFG